MANPVAQITQEISLIQNKTKVSRQFLKQVYESWVGGVSEASLYDLTIETLSPDQKEVLIPNLWRRRGYTPDGELIKLKQDYQLFNFYKQFGKLGIMVTGKTGTGKQNLLIELLGQLVSDQLSREIPKIPVILSFQDYDPSLPLDTWIVEETSRFYGIDASYPQNWVNQNRLIPLLFGLEYVSIEHREKVAIALETEWFQADDRSAVVTCHEGAYQPLASVFDDIVQIECEELSTQQTSHFLSKYGKELRGLRIAIEQDDRVMALARTPLMLNVMALAFTNMPHFDQIIIPTTSSLELLFNRIFTFFSKRLIKSQENYLNFGYKNITFAIGWLATRMGEMNRSHFTITDLQPSWLQNTRQIWRYVWLSRLFLGMLQGLSIGLIMAGLTVALAILGPAETLPAWMYWMPLFNIVTGSVLGGIGSVMGGVWDAFQMARSHALSPYHVSVRHITFSIAVGLGAGIVQALRNAIASTVIVPAEMIVFVATTTILAFLVSTTSERMWRSDIGKVNEIRLDGRYGPDLAASIRRSWIGTLIGLAGGLIIGYASISGEVVQLLFPNWSIVAAGGNFTASPLIPLLGGGIIGALSGFIVHWMSNAYGDKKADPTLKPRKRILSQLERTIVTLTLVLVGGGIILFIGLASLGFMTKGVTGILFASTATALLGIGIALATSLNRGLSDLIKHFMLRVTLWFSLSIPLRLGNVLEDAVEVLLMYEVGDRYIFIHPLVQDFYIRRHHFKQGATLAGSEDIVLDLSRTKSLFLHIQSSGNK